MTRRILRLTLVVVLLANWTIPSPAWAWGKEGHQIVGFIAEKHLTPEAQAAIEGLLGDGHRISDDAVANWADGVRNVIRATGPWHYVDIPVEAGKYDPKRDCKNSDCVIARIERFREILADKTAQRVDRQQALKYLVHLVGDLHQPLHCAERLDSNGNPDHGGNLCIVHFLDSPETNLHKVWDTHLLVRSLGQTSLDEYAGELNSRITELQQGAWRKGRARSWAVQSNKAAAEFVYAGVAADGPATRLDEAYVTKNQKVVDELLSKAGVRLAEILNEALQ